MYFFHFRHCCFHFRKSDLGLSHFLYLSLTCSFFLVFLNIRNIFIIAVLMFLLIWASVSTDWLFYLLCGIFSCFFACMVIFNWMPNIVKFTGLNAGYMYIHFVFLWTVLNCVLWYSWAIWKLFANSLIPLGPAQTEQCFGVVVLVA